MSTLFQDIFAYHLDFNSQILNEIEKHYTRLPDRTYPMYCHILNAHQVWNARILGLDQLPVFGQHSIVNCQKLNQENYENTCTILSEKDLGTTIKYRSTSGKLFQNKIADILFHINNHTTHHRGQIVTDFRKISVVPIATDYIFYKRQSIIE